MADDAAAAGGATPILVIRHDVYVHQAAGDGIASTDAKLDQLLAYLQETRVMSEATRVAIERATTVMDSVAALIKDFAARIRDTGTEDPAVLEAVAKMESKTNELAALVVANTGAQAETGAPVSSANPQATGDQPQTGEAETSTGATTDASAGAGAETTANTTEGDGSGGQTA